MFLARMNSAIVIAIVMLAVGCKKEPLTHNSASESVFTKPTASELFNLRSKCVEIGNKIAIDKADKFVGSDIVQEHSSHFDIKTDRCYVELDEKMGDPAKFLDYYSQALYDGQTGELLAIASVDRDKKSSTNSLGALVSQDYDSTKGAIDSLMADETKP